MSKPVAPTKAEIAAANEVLNRAAEVEMAIAREAMKPISDVTNSPAFAEIKALVDAIPSQFLSNMQVAPHIMALKAGLHGLASVAPPAPIEEAPAA